MTVANQLSNRTGVVIAVLAAATLAYGAQPDSVRLGDEALQKHALQKLVADLRAEQKLVGLAATVMADGEVVAAAADGERKLGSGVPVEVGDRWHLGSITKSITATMIARLVERGDLDWQSTVGQTLGEEGVHVDWRGVTLSQLLTHTAGAPANFSLAVRIQRPAEGRPTVDARRQAVLGVLVKPPLTPPGEAFRYSNVGFTIAGAMAEAATGESWEDLVRREVFEPLGLEHAGFGPPKSRAPEFLQPRGHVTRLGFKVAVADTADNTPIMGPAGTACMTLEELCRYGNEHLRGQRGEGKLFTAASYQRLHTPVLDNYGCGWVVTQRDGKVVSCWHNGSNTMWYAYLTFDLESNLVVAVAANDGDIPAAEKAAVRIAAAASDIVDVKKAGAGQAD
ncbi:D-alanyl-D-alanine carboxypeptidase precursor [Posidoniimonas polymericola]|uniref:D-alanyl-D-alanine carboxypeptidase n=1 Tax=Posidoniimonas polymericola TaxID=2528002 RepID=A0A5C5YSU0_9BACT|nr:serine hydrolase domain-containing protein [Posidoniimonas polymericola]TWT78025.1 D-alanyl-D-alanine carboxypeptidase precursor [Posidoniimonas polymericola]